MDKIKMTTPLVEMDGDEMTRILWKMIKDELLLPFIDLKTEYYDLGLEHRDATGDQVTIDSANAAKKYGLQILKAGIQNISNNRTRFIAISKKLVIGHNADKISLIFALPHTTGSLYRILGRFSASGLNLTKLESRPVGNGEFRYCFYVDLLGSIRDEKTLALMCALYEELPDFKFLGNYHEY